MTIDKISARAEEFLAEPSNLILSTIRKDGRPQLSPVWFVWQDSEFLISTTPSTAKWKNLQRDPRCTAIIDNLDGRYLIVTGDVETWTEESPHKVTTEIVRKYKDDHEFEPYMETIRQERPVRGIIRLTPDSIITRELD